MIILRIYIIELILYIGRLGVEPGIIKIKHARLLFSMIVIIDI